ncbi:hypothetical protein Tco_0400546 [Tanacetum coccineum]
MLDHQLEICQDTMGNELTTAVQLIAFLKKQISDSRRPKVHDCLLVPQLTDVSSTNELRWFAIHHGSNPFLGAKDCLVPQANGVCGKVAY